MTYSDLTRCEDGFYSEAFDRISGACINSRYIFCSEKEGGRNWRPYSDGSGNNNTLVYVAHITNVTNSEFIEPFAIEKQ